MAAAFIGLNIADAWLTSQLTAMGYPEGNPIVESYGGDMLIKGLLAAAIALLLVRFGKARLLVILNICMLGVVLWNGFGLRLS